MIEEFAHALETVFERPTAFRAIRRYWYLSSSVRCSGLPAAAVYAFKRPPVYTATSRLSAMSVNMPRTPLLLAGSLQAAQELAGTFARVVQSSEVAEPWPTRCTPRRHGRRPRQRHTGAGQPVRDDHATASSGTVATKAANAALTASTPYARKLLGASSGGSALLATIRADSIALARARRISGSSRARRSRDVVVGGGNRDPNNPRPHAPASDRAGDRCGGRRADAAQGAQAAYTAQARTVRLAGDRHGQPSGERDERPQAGRADRNPARAVGRRDSSASRRPWRSDRERCAPPESSSWLVG